MANNDQPHNQGTAPQTQTAAQQPPAPPTPPAAVSSPAGDHQPQKRAPMPYDEDALKAMIKHGDLSKLSDDQRAAYYWQVCEGLGLNPMTQPFRYLVLSGKMILYCDRSGAQQLNKLHGVSHHICMRENVGDCYVVTARASLPDGRFTESIGAVAIGNLKGDNLANALMKAETKAKRRSTLDLLGLGILDESEMETIRGAQTVAPDFSTRPAAPHPQQQQQAPAQQQQSNNDQQRPQQAQQQQNNQQPAQQSNKAQPAANSPLAIAKDAMNQAGVNIRSMEEHQKACKQKYKTAAEISQVLNDNVKDVKMLANLYWINAEMVENNPQLKQQFTDKKADYFVNNREPAA